MRIEMREAREKIIVAEDIRLRILGEAENLRLSNDRQEKYNELQEKEAEDLSTNLIIHEQKNKDFTKIIESFCTLESDRASSDIPPLLEMKQQTLQPQALRNYEIINALNDFTDKDLMKIGSFPNSCSTKNDTVDMNCNIFSSNDCLTMPLNQTLNQTINFNQMNLSDSFNSTQNKFEMTGLISKKAVFNLERVYNKFETI